MGGAEHATGHLLYARFWTKVLHDLGYVPYDEPFQKMINQGMIQGNSALIFIDKNTKKYISLNKIADFDVAPIHIDISLLKSNDEVDLDKLRQWRDEFKNAEFITEDDGRFLVKREVEKMSKSKYNVQTPDELVDKYGADTLRCYEMFLGPVEQHKPWDTKGIEGVNRFLKKFWRLFFSEKGFSVSNENPTKEEWKILHRNLKKITEDIERFSFNTVVSQFMITTNELAQAKCNKRKILEPLVIALSPYAPHIAEELWHLLGKTSSVTQAQFPQYDESYLVETSHKYPVMINGKMRFTVELPMDMSKEAIEKEVLAMEQAQKWIEGKQPKKVIVVPKKIVNIVV
jgi:leucyl-tRNA synthetase